ncbi:MAG TPA: cyclic dehypoxanthinyl futalosine synthase [Candidatus Thermoplasmatota archaeon]|nr:cyclic dehypoxanthinyl futalosine synthase [Candidatus Thermoplasmatota archaeon]
MTSVERLLSESAEGRRLSRDEAARLWREAPLAELAAAAHAARNRRTDPRTVTYVVDRNINYTNVCNVYCSFCAFYRTKKDEDAYTLSTEQVLAKVEELVAIGGTQVLLQGGLNEDLPLDHMKSLFRAVRDRFPQVDLHSLTATEIEFWARKHGMTFEAVLRELRDAGLKSLPGGGMEILVDRVRNKVSPLKTDAQTYLAIHRAAHELGMTSTATMMFGTVETIEERIEHLDAVRALQDASRRAGRRGFTAFIPWSYQHDERVPLRVPPTTADDYLRTMAVSRLYLDNVEHLQSGWVTEGPKIAQVALRFGADDWGGVLMEENVISAAGTVFSMTPRDACRLIRAAGHAPAQRDTYYSILRRWEREDPPEVRIRAPEHGTPVMPTAGTNASFRV